MVSKVLYFHPEPWRNDPIWHTFSRTDGLKPPPGGSTWTLASLHRCWKRSFKGSFLASMNEGWPSKKGKPRWWRETNHGMFLTQKGGLALYQGLMDHMDWLFHFEGDQVFDSRIYGALEGLFRNFVIIWVDVVWWPLLNAATGFRCLFLHIHTYR